jgi:four helix bundle protein
MGMNKRTYARALPHHRLVAYQVALELLTLVRKANIRDAKLRDQALRASKSVCLNVAEAAGRTSPADKARVFGIARGEALEVAAALEIAHVAGDVDAASADLGAHIADRLYALLTGLAR